MNRGANKPDLPTAHGLTLKAIKAMQHVEPKPDDNTLPTAMGQSQRTASGLTVKMDSFAKHVAQGHSLSEAYRRSYNAGDMQQETIANHAHVLAKRDDVRARIIQHQKQLQLDVSHDDPQSVRRFLFDYLVQTVGDDSLKRTDRNKAADMLGRVGGIDMWTAPKDADAKTAKDSVAELTDRLKALGLLAEPIKQVAVQSAPDTAKAEELPRPEAKG